MTMGGLAEHHERQEGEHAKEAGEGVPGGHRNHLGRLAEEGQKRLAGKEGQGSRKPKADGQDSSPLEASAHRGTVAGPHGLGDQGIQGQKDPHGKNHYGEKV